uniref:Uncharacterized protein n=1 Tax=Populus alba TaxID=43335 RepID=A0A4U5PKU5_POPAL|nr:hypothetical protein D5086_0000210940 [Populus alba]
MGSDLNPLDMDSVLQQKIFQVLDSVLPLFFFSMDGLGGLGFTLFLILLGWTWWALLLLSLAARFWQLVGPDLSLAAKFWQLILSCCLVSAALFVMLSSPYRY